MKKLRGSMIYRVIAYALAAFIPAFAYGQMNSFDVQLGGKLVGKSTFTLAPVKQGLKLSSHISCHVNGVETDIAEEFRFTAEYAYVDGSSSNNITQMHTAYLPNKARTDLVVSMVQGGAQESKHLAIKPDMAILPAYDAGAAQALLLLATTHPTAGNVYDVVVPAAGPAPRQSAGEAAEDAQAIAGGRPPQGNFAYDALWTKGPDSAGTLDGRPVALKTYILTAGKYTWTFFADEANSLMQVNVSMLRASYVRAKFRLNGAE